MTFSNAQRLRPVRRYAIFQACWGFALALASGSTFAAAALTQAAQDPAKVAPASLAVSKIDFKRGEDGTGRLILQFDGHQPGPTDAGRQRAGGHQQRQVAGRAATPASTSPTSQRRCSA